MENSLSHYGVLGMKWGVRKKERISSVASGKTSKFEERTTFGVYSKRETIDARKKTFKSLSEGHKLNNTQMGLLLGRDSANRVLDGVAKGVTYENAKTATTKMVMGKAAVGAAIGLGGQVLLINLIMKQV